MDVAKVAGAVGKWPVWVLLVIAGLVSAVLACTEISTNPFHIEPARSRNTALLTVGVAAILLGAGLGAGLGFLERFVAGVDTTGVREDDAGYWIKLHECVVRVVFGRIEDLKDTANAETAFVLPVSEFFDLACFEDETSSCGAFVRAHGSKPRNLHRLVEKKLEADPTVKKEQVKRTAVRTEASFGTGTCVSVRSKRRCLIFASVTTQRTQQGVRGSLEFTRAALVRAAHVAADNDKSRLVMPLFGTGKGRVPEPLAFMGQLLAVWETLQTDAGRAMKEVVIVVFKKEKSIAQVHGGVVRRALALALMRNGT